LYLTFNPLDTEQIVRPEEHMVRTNGTKWLTIFDYEKKY